MSACSEPAFPRDERYQGHNGMTLRDWFAGQALAVIVAKHEPERTTDSGFKFEREVALGAYAYADAMLAERAK